MPFNSSNGIEVLPSFLQDVVGVIKYQANIRGKGACAATKLDLQSKFFVHDDYRNKRRQRKQMEWDLFKFPK